MSDDPKRRKRPRRKPEKREIELKDLRTVATIYTKGDGPYVNLVTGREPHPVGRIVCIKAGMRALMWESIKAEKPMIELCEVASPVHRMMTQPHELAMKVIGQRRAWRYRPDMRIEVDRGFADEVERGTPFAEAVAAWRPDDEETRADTVQMIVEVKDDADPRIDDPLYAEKLALAKKVYTSIGWRFITVVRSRDIDAPLIAPVVRSLMLDHSASIGPGDLSAATAAMPRGSATLGALMEALGGGGVARAKAAALHVRRIVSIDLTRRLSPDTPVRAILDGRAIFEMPGRYPW